MADRETSGALGAAALGVDLLRDAVLPSVRDLHGAISRRVGPRVPVVREVSALQGAVADRVYAGLGRGLAGASAGLRRADDAAQRAGVGATLEQGARGRFAVAALNGLFGDRIQREHPGLEIAMAPRAGAHDVDVSADGIAAAYPEAGADVVVLLHGLGEDDVCWRVGAGASGRTYPDHLRERGWTPVVLRYNTGLPIAENGVALASLLDRLVSAWPVPVRRLSLVGHSMGGLVIRSACAVLPGPGTTAWAPLVGDVVTLGTPHLGAPVAWGLSSGVSLLSVLPESAPFGRLLDHRSAGIFDLRDGLPPDVANLPSARYHLVSAAVGRPGTRAGAVVSGVLGDGLVRPGSAAGRPRRGAALFPGADLLHLTQTNHFGLLNHPDVYAALDRWLGRGSGPAATAGARRRTPEEIR
ncbi:permease [Marmoricola endophyticus]|uniref:Permease n=1 Tax=Marmoricola endophyticus TaxID=2040280 RepID=A0A917F8K7_9ACTN|nr:alpha/beta hydrolase [Marmoricola endophyticus]GGF58010.1 permease [Marmoricola endophyticus]